MYLELPQRLPGWRCQRLQVLQCNCTGNLLVGQLPPTNFKPPLRMTENLLVGSVRDVARP
jgi:hypothetical protein